VQQQQDPDRGNQAAANAQAGRVVDNYVIRKDGKNKAGPK
jgi:hypothetical protein